MKNREKLYLGVDAGGTKCKARLVDQNDALMAEAIAGPANLRLGAPMVGKTIKKACLDAIGKANLKDINFKNISIGLGIAGISRTEAMSSLCADPFFSSFEKTVFVSDAEIANLGAHAGNDGGIVIIGTGSIAMAKIKGKKIKLGGYGFPISDLGSGAYMGLHAIRRSVNAMDALIPKSQMTDEILDYFNNDINKIIDILENMSTTDFAALAPIVVKHAQQNDIEAIKIMNKSAAHISSMIRALDKLKAPRISLVGGLAPIIKERLEPSIQAILSPPIADPLNGAIGLVKNK